ncbi:MAG: nitroreductase family protein [Planctomycetaceae bacterium]
MHITAAIQRRRSIRKFQSRAIPDGVIEELLELARHAPSSLNGQPWHFVVIKDQQTKSALVDIKNRHCPQEKSAYPADFLCDTPVVIVVCVESARSHGREVENAVFAASYIMLAAGTFGLGSTYLTASRPGQPALSDEIRHLLRIPDGFESLSIIPLGYPDEIPPAKNLPTLSEIMHRDRFYSQT